PEDYPARDRRGAAIDPRPNSAQLRSGNRAARDCRSARAGTRRPPAADHGQPIAGQSDQMDGSRRAGDLHAELRERLGIAPFDPALPRAKTVSADEAATRLGICLRSVHKLIRKDVLPATQLMYSAPWQIPVAALDSEAVKIGVREIVGRRPKFYRRFQEDKTLRLPGF